MIVCTTVYPVKSTEQRNYNNSIRPTQLFCDHHMHRRSLRSVAGYRSMLLSDVSTTYNHSLRIIGHDEGVARRVQCLQLAEISKDGQYADDSASDAGVINHSESSSADFIVRLLQYMNIGACLLSRRHLTTNFSILEKPSSIEN